MLAPVRHNKPIVRLVSRKPSNPPRQFHASDPLLRPGDLSHRVLSFRGPYRHRHTDNTDVGEVPAEFTPIHRVFKIAPVFLLQDVDALPVDNEGGVDVIKTPDVGHRFAGGGPGSSVPQLRGAGGFFLYFGDGGGQAAEEGVDAALVCSSTCHC